MQSSIVPTELISTSGASQSQKRPVLEHLHQPTDSVHNLLYLQTRSRLKQALPHIGTSIAILSPCPHENSCHGRGGAGMYPGSSQFRRGRDKRGRVGFYVLRISYATFPFFTPRFTSIFFHSVLYMTKKGRSPNPPFNILSSFFHLQ